MIRHLLARVNFDHLVAHHQLHATFFESLDQFIHIGKTAVLGVDVVVVGNVVTHVCLW